MLDVCVQIGRHCQFIFLPVIWKDNIFGWLCSGITSGNQCSRDHMEIELGSAAKRQVSYPLYHHSNPEIITKREKIYQAKNALRTL